MVMEQSIFKSVKDMLDVGEEDDSFDSSLLMHINGVLSDLHDLGIGPSEGFEIEGEDENWVDLMGSYKDLNRVRTWFFLKMLMIFDPPQTSFLMEARNKQIEEATWRITNNEDRRRREAESA